MPEQQLVEIAKAIGADAKIVIMDEPTASLMDQEVDRLVGVIRLLRTNGCGIVYISHRLDEVVGVRDPITGLPHAAAVASSDPALNAPRSLLHAQAGHG